jgi:hypothetical protein
MDILGGGLVGRPAQEIGKLFDVADILVVLGLSRRIVMSSISRRRNGLMALSVIGGSCLGCGLQPLDLKTGRLLLLLPETLPLLQITATAV